MSSFVRFSATCTIEEVLSRYPSTATIFHLLGLDTACRPETTLRDAAAHTDADLGVLLAMLEASACASLAGARSR